MGVEILSRFANEIGPSGVCRGPFLLVPVPESLSLSPPSRSFLVPVAARSSGGSASVLYRPSIQVSDGPRGGPLDDLPGADGNIAAIISHTLFSSSRWTMK